MVEETANQPTNPADEEYEYEYIELAEGEELPEGAEYEYEYVRQRQSFPETGQICLRVRR